jgi:Kef-type K+ transport system membrane component KefB
MMGHPEPAVRQARGRPKGGCVELELDPYLKLLALIALLFLLPKVLVRLGFPSPVTEMALGVICGPLVLDVLRPDELIATLAALGISALFLFAGMEVSLRAFVDRRRTIFVHTAIQVLLYAAAAAAAFQLWPEIAVAVLIAAAVMSSSAAFIIPALDMLRLPEDLKTWIKQKAITNELLAILAVLCFSNTSSPRAALMSIAAITAMVALVPLAFVVFHRTILKWAPRTEFSFVMILALFAAYVSHHVGVHYLVGAFVVGVVARRYLRWGEQHGMAMASVHSALDSFRFFSAFLMPFFFFQAGLHLPAGAFAATALLFAGAAFLTAVPLRVGVVMLHRRWQLREPWHHSWNVGLLVAPTTVFSVAMAEILRARFHVSESIVGGLILYGAATSFLPLLTRRVRSTEYEDLIAMPEMCLVSHLGEEAWFDTPAEPHPTPEVEPVAGTAEHEQPNSG